MLNMSAEAARHTLARVMYLQQHKEYEQHQMSNAGIDVVDLHFILHLHMANSNVKVREDT